MHDVDVDMQLLIEGVTQLGFTLDDRQRSQFSRYMQEIYLFNSAYHLVGAEGSEFVIKHLLDSIAPLAVFKKLAASLPEDVQICDVGSGAGLPGIPLAIMLDQRRFTLIERMGRRAGFLRNAIAGCNLDDRLTVMQSDLSEVREQFGIVVFRAFHPLVDIIRPIGSIVAERGFACAYKGRSEAIQQELADLDALVRTDTGGHGIVWNTEIIPVQVPFLDAPRNLCVLRKDVMVQG